VNDDIVLVERFPDVDGYLRLRAAAGMHEKTREAAARALPNTLYGVQLQRDGELVAMGRVIGDNGCFFTVVDIAVAPEWQGQGLGKRIMAALDAWLLRNVPPSRTSRWWPMATPSISTRSSASSRARPSRSTWNT